MHALTQTYNHSVVMPIWLVLTCEVPEKFEKKNTFNVNFNFGVLDIISKGKLKRTLTVTPTGTYIFVNRDR